LIESPRAEPGSLSKNRKMPEATDRLIRFETGLQNKDYAIPRSMTPEINSISLEPS
jgi:hypothetical protein